MSFLRDLNIPVIQNIQDFAEAMRELHFAVATSESREIAPGDSKAYKLSETVFKAAIAAAYPELDMSRIYEVWLDCNESVAYCANWVKTDIRSNNDFMVDSTIDDITESLPGAPQTDMWDLTDYSKFSDQ